MAGSAVNKVDTPPVQRVVWRVASAVVPVSPTFHVARMGRGRVVVRVYRVVMVTEMTSTTTI